MTKQINSRVLGTISDEIHVRVDYDADATSEEYARAALKVAGGNRYKTAGMYQEKATGIFYGYYIVRSV